MIHSERISYPGSETINLLFKKDSTVGFRTIIWVVVCLVLLFLSHHSRAFQLLRSKASIVVVPIQYVASLPVRGIDVVVTSISSRRKLKETNQHLQAELLLLKAKLQKQYAIESENKLLKALLQSSNRLNVEVTEAELLAVSSDPFMHQIVLNKGSHDHVFVGQAVIDAHGIMGQVVQVDPLTSRVMLLTDPKSSIPVQLERTGLRAIAKGDSSGGHLVLQHLTVTEDVKVGDLLVTSGLGGCYPFGYPVGHVISVEHNPGDQFAQIKVKPDARLNRSRLVLLIWPSKKSAGEPT